MREAFDYLREHLGEDVASAHLVIAGDSVVLVRDGDELIDVVNKRQGQGVLNILPLGGVTEERRRRGRRAARPPAPSRPSAGAAVALSPGAPTSVAG